MLLGVDVGGTFTDAVLATGGRIVTAKALTTPGDQSEGVMAAIATALGRADASPADVELFAHGMTVATNALLEGHGARTVLVATQGFEDVVALGRQARADLYRLCAAHPAPLVPPQRRVGARERTGPGGVLLALADPDALAADVASHEPEAVAVVLLHAYAHPSHERAIGAALARRLPAVHVSLSHEVVGTFREYERAATTEVDAALSPLLARYLRRLLQRAAQAGLPEPRIMQSSGGLAAAQLAARHAAFTVLSGPAGGAAAAALVARRSGQLDLVCFDMGGTSCDVCVVEGGAVRETAGREVGGRPLALAMVDIHTVGAGGGSVAWRDPGGALRVGPRSAGAQPGPACYGRGGTEPTVTDANLLLGRLDASAPLAGGVALDATAAGAAVEGLAAALGLERLACAEGIVRVADSEMVRALRVMTVEQGIDPRRFALLAFGGAGPLHAAAIAADLGMTTILCPRASGVLSALGLAAADRRATEQRTVLLGGDALTDEALVSACGDLGAAASATLGARREPGAAAAGTAGALVDPASGTPDTPVAAAAGAGTAGALVDPASGTPDTPVAAAAGAGTAGALVDPASGTPDTPVATASGAGTPGALVDPASGTPDTPVATASGAGTPGALVDPASGTPDTPVATASGAGTPGALVDPASGTPDTPGAAAAGTPGAPGTRIDIAYDVRYRGQAHELTVRGLAGDAGVAEVRRAFEDLHEERYGYRDGDAECEVVTIRATAILPGPELDLAAAGDARGCERSRRRVIFDGVAHDAEVLRGEPAPGERFAGPAICELREATLAVPPAWRGCVDDAGTIVLERAP